MGTLVFETYPALTMIALGWTIPDSSRAAGRLPKYNPTRKTFAPADWQHVCRMTAAALRERRLLELARWAKRISEIPAPRKRDQDALDACICLLVGLHMVQAGECLLVGDQRSGYMVVPFGEALHEELQARCTASGRDRDEWVKRLSPR